MVCPGCGIVVVRDGGCNWMECGGCGRETKRQGRLASVAPVVVAGIIVIDTFLVILEINKYCQMRYMFSLVVKPIANSPARAQLCIYVHMPQGQLCNRCELLVLEMPKE